MNKKLKFVFAAIMVFILISIQFSGVFANESYVTLRFGSRGSEVTRLQQELKNQGFYNNVVDGIYGRVTERAVINFQSSRNLKVDGIAGRNTQQALYASTSGVLKFGSRGAGVTRLQQELRNQGFYSGSVDGIYGKVTERAVINFQISRKLTIDGIAGPRTQAALYGNTVTTAAVQNFNNDDVYWLARIIHAEAQAEPYSGKVAVGNVILNRVRSKDFPNTVYGVIFERYKGIAQFCPVDNGTIYNNPSQSSINAAREAINGARPVGAATFFFNPRLSRGTWIVNNKSFVTSIGNHVFYR